MPMRGNAVNGLRIDKGLFYYRKTYCPLSLGGSEPAPVPWGATARLRL